MSKSREVGKIGENAAVEFLLALDYKVLERNWRFSRAEIDIIAKHEGILIFVEVKTRSYTSFGMPEQFVTSNKERLMIDAANQYMVSINYDWEIRFDVISVVLHTAKAPTIKHFKDVFY